MTGGHLGRALTRYLAERGSGDVYVDPAAFTAFIDGGANLGLYATVIDSLAAEHRALNLGSVLDIGCGDGRVTAAVVPASSAVTLLEPSAEMLAVASERLRNARAFNATLAELLAADASTWTIAQSTFALHAIEPIARAAQLAELAGRCERLLVVEFDVPAFTDNRAHADYLTERYERGLAEYPDDDLVAQGFLMPVLVGQLDPSQPRHTWEQPIDAWVADLRAAGFTDVVSRELCDYWWAPAHLIVATP